MKTFTGLHECPHCHEDHDEPYSYCGACREYMRERVAVYKATNRGKEVQQRSAAKWRQAYPERVKEQGRRANLRYRAKHSAFISEQRFCDYCQQPYMTIRDHQRFCSEAHKIAFNNAKQKKNK